MATLMNDYWSSFKEELIATSLVLVVAVGGSFFVLNQIIKPPAPKPSLTNQAADEIVSAIENNQNGTVLGNEIGSVMPVPTFLPSTAPTVITTPTSSPYASEVFYGVGGLYETEQYKFGINSPRLAFDAREPASRKFIVDLVLTNKNVPPGLQNAMTATIVKDGVVIVPKAAMSVTEAKVVMPGETLEYQARLSLIEGTDISVISFDPNNGIAPITHVLRP
jgi:hypothetical protein